MKTVFTSQSEVAHLWAHQLQDYGRYAHGNFYFSDNTIYSYGSHYPCGEIATNRRGERAYMLNSKMVSNTTSKHMGYVIGAIPAYEQTFYSDGCHTPQSYTNYQGKSWNQNYGEAIKFVACKLDYIYEAFQKQRKARFRDYSGDAAMHIKQLRDFILFWELDKVQTWVDGGGRKKRHPAIMDYFKSKSNTAHLKCTFGCSNEHFAYIMELICLLDKERWVTSECRFYACLDAEVRRAMADFFKDDVVTDIKARIDKLEAAERRAKAKELRQHFEDGKKALAKWREGKLNYFDDWKYMEFVKTLGWNAALRIHNDCIETSKGIHLSFEEGKRLWRIIQQFESGKPFRHNLAIDLSGHQWKFNQYEDHVLTAGCHQIPFSECKAIANQMGW